MSPIALALRRWKLCLLSRCGPTDELVRTPGKSAALKAERGSLEKPEKKVVVKKVEVDVEVENADC